MTVTSLPPPAAPLVGVMLVTLGAAGTVPAGALDEVAGLASPDDATAVVLDWIRAGVTLLEVTTPFTVIVPLVNGLVLLVHDICCPDGAPHTQPVPTRRRARRRPAASRSPSPGSSPPPLKNWPPPGR